MKNSRKFRCGQIPRKLNLAKSEFSCIFKDIVYNLKLSHKEISKCHQRKTFKEETASILHSSRS